MNTFTPYEKLSKKKKRELDLKNRKSWNGICPVTRKSENPKAYNRRKTMKRFDSYDGLPYFLCLCYGAKIDAQTRAAIICRYVYADQNIFFIN